VSEEMTEHNQLDALIEAEKEIKRLTAENESLREAVCPNEYSTLETEENRGRAVEILKSVYVRGLLDRTIPQDNGSDV